eukprot:GHVO01061417.1.p1 GENE.GHVO01061417.1~~GHVO01061417.1.p1  ORF type:complete len:204 (+),score=26.13 GHVO01061417.1:189-800(+)
MNNDSNINNINNNMHILTCVVLSARIAYFLEVQSIGSCVFLSILASGGESASLGAVAHVAPGAILHASSTSPAVHATGGSVTTTAVHPGGSPSPPASPGATARTHTLLSSLLLLFHIQTMFATNRQRPGSQDGLHRLSVVKDDKAEVGDVSCPLTLDANLNDRSKTLKELLQFLLQDAVRQIANKQLMAVWEAWPARVFLHGG